MWAFGYGSLMWGNRERDFGCLCRVVATLPGFRRAFNKASGKNWGTRAHSGLTLNLAADSSAGCTGIAFEFAEDRRQAVLDYLQKREGKGFDLEEHKICLGDGRRPRQAFPSISDQILLLARPR